MATPEQAAQQVREAQEALRIGIAKGQAALDALSGLGDAAGAAAHAATGGAVDPFVFRFAIFVMAIFVGYYVVWSVTNAISSVIVVGALLSVGVTAAPALGDGPLWARVLGFIALILASVNIFGGFLVTERMLSMYKKKG